THLHSNWHRNDAHFQRNRPPRFPITFTIREKEPRFTSPCCFSRGVPPWNETQRCGGATPLASHENESSAIILQSLNISPKLGKDLPTYYGAAAPLLPALPTCRSRVRNHAMKIHHYLLGMALSILAGNTTLADEELLPPDRSIE